MRCPVVSLKKKKGVKCEHCRATITVFKLIGHLLCAGCGAHFHALARLLPGPEKRASLCPFSRMGQLRLRESKSSAQGRMTDVWKSWELSEHGR